MDANSRKKSPTYEIEENPNPSTMKVLLSYIEFKKTKQNKTSFWFLRTLESKIKTTEKVSI